MLNYGEESLVCDNEGIKVINRFPLENPFFFPPFERVEKSIEKIDNWIFYSFNPFLPRRRRITNYSEGE